MRNIKITLEYNGTHYKGWQIQKSRKSSTIQETIENVLRQILRKKIKLIGSGRTDAGVHASGQVANFKTDHTISLEKLQEGLNALLPEDICVVNVQEAAADFHSRFSARSKIYRYTILNRMHRSALLRENSYFCRYPLDLQLMQKEARALVGTHNFKAFAASSRKEKNPLRRIKRIEITRRGEVISVEIEADSFLYNMARNIVGTLIDVGRGKLPRASAQRILNSRDRRQAGPTAPACGLCLVKVKY